MKRKSWFSIRKPGFMVPVTGMPVRGQSLDHCTGMPVAGQASCCHMLPARRLTSKMQFAAVVIVCNIVLGLYSNEMEFLTLFNNELT